MVSVGEPAENRACVSVVCGQRDARMQPLQWIPRLPFR